MLVDSGNYISAHIQSWILIDDESIDISFLARQHRRRLSRTVQLALTAYHRCNPSHGSLRSVYASRYGEYVRTFGILQDIAANAPTSPAAFSVSVHNTASGIASIGTNNRAPSSTVAANAATFEAGFLEAALQAQETESGDVALIGVDEPLPELYSDFKGTDDQARAVGVRLGAQGGRKLTLSWQRSTRTGREPNGIGQSGGAVFKLLETGCGTWSMSDGRLDWEWFVETV